MKTSIAKICVPVCVSRVDELAGAIKRAAEVGDLVELRLDCLDDAELDAVKRTLPEYVRQAGVPVILTLRSPEQGGQTSANYETRHRFWSSLGSLPGNCFVDLEIDLVSAFAADGSTGKPAIDWNQIICSQHDFEGVPLDLEGIYGRIAATPAGIAKIAVQAEEASDCISVFRLLERAQREEREIIAIAMGPAGIMTRVLGPSRGSFLTYGSLDDESATAPGQLTARELRQVYRIDQIDRQTEILGIVGKPVGHSLSPYIHNAAFAAGRMNAVYLPLEVGDLIQFMRRMASPRTRELDWNLRGLSVTAPHKSSVMNCLDSIDPAAEEIGAVNTIVIRDDELRGYNTDVLGFILPLRGRFGSLKGARCAVIGAGGGARAALWALRSEGAEVVMFARDLGKASLVAAEFAVPCRQLADTSFDGFQVVVNATPLGTRGEREDKTTAGSEQLRGVRLAYDLVYNPLETRFLREARCAGCETLGGIEMLLAQAVEQFRLWTGKEPDIEAMRAGVSRALEE